MPSIPQQRINAFLKGDDPMERIVKFECDYNSDKVNIYYRDGNGDKKLIREDFYPFLWAKESVAKQLYGDKNTLRKALKERNIGCKGLIMSDGGEKPHARMIDGYRILFYTKRPMSNSEFHRFFENGGYPVQRNDDYITVPSVEQCMIRTGKRLFKGCDDYGELRRTVWDVELSDNSTVNRILTYTVDNPNDEGLYNIIDTDNELNTIESFLKSIQNGNTDILIGYDSEKKLWPLIEKRLKVYNKSLNDYNISRKGESYLKLGSSTETFTPTVIKGVEDVDALSAIRKAWEDDTDIKGVDVTYMAEYLKIERKNKKEERFENLWRIERIEYQLNQANFLIAKLSPLPFDRVNNGGPVAVWRLLMMAWSYKNNLAIPEKEERRPFVGGLSKLLEAGYVENVVKLDYNSLYPSIMLTYNLSSAVDIQGVILRFLEYILTARETYKNRKTVALREGDYGGAMRNDILQRSLKKLDNSVYGALASGEPFPWADISVAERTSCIGRMMMRVLFSHFTQIGYKPIVGDTDGINFQLPDKFLYTNEEPYISSGEGRNSIKGQAYVGLWADVCEFEDLYLNKVYNGGVNKMGLGVDAFYKATINLRRKVYANLMHDGTVKLVGSSIKSREMPLYISRFFDKAIPLLLNKRTAEFATFYYDYIEKIYNLQMPPMDLATRVVIKTPIESYRKACENNPTKQKRVIYELLIRDNIDINVGDTVYYINVGKGKNDFDLDKTAHYYTLNSKGEKEFFYRNSRGQRVINNGAILTIDNYMDLQYKKYKERNPNSKEYRNFSDFVGKNFPDYKEDDEFTLNCAIIKDNSFIPYNADIYINLLNKKIKPLLSCFKRSVRSVKESDDDGDNILIPNPRGRKVFTINELPLSFGNPIDPPVQDSYDKFISLDDKEIELWLNINETPPFIGEETWERTKENFRSKGIFEIHHII